MFNYIDTQGPARWCVNIIITNIPCKCWPWCTCPEGHTGPLGYSPPAPHTPPWNQHEQEWERECWLSLPVLLVSFWREEGRKKKGREGSLEMRKTTVGRSSSLSLVQKCYGPMLQLTQQQHLLPDTLAPEDLLCPTSPLTNTKLVALWGKWFHKTNQELKKSLCSRGWEHHSVRTDTGLCPKTTRSSLQRFYFSWGGSNWMWRQIFSLDEN